MSFKEMIRDEPYLTSADYQTMYSEQCVSVYKLGERWYLGTGIDPKYHPLMGAIGISGCGNCNSNKVKVIAAFSSMDQFEDSAIIADYWHYEIVCEDCGKYTQYSSSED